MRFTLVHYLALVGLARGLAIPTQGMSIYRCKISVHRTEQ